MTREYARVKVKIWADTDFRDLSDPAQSLYFRLLSSPTMNLCGVADWRPKRIAALTRGMTAEGVEAAAQELAERGYIVVDEDTEEVLIRSFVRHDGLIKTPNIAASMAKDYAGTASALLRGVIVFELVRMKADEPEMKGWSVASHLLREPSINPSEMASPKASGMPSIIPSAEALPIGSGNGSHIPHPSSVINQPSSSSKKAGAKPKTDMPQGWEPNAKHIEKARSLGLSVSFLAEQFTSHHLARGNQFVNWDAAFHTWIGNATSFGGGNQRPQLRAVVNDGRPEGW